MFFIVDISILLVVLFFIFLVYIINAFIKWYVSIGII
jgi:hypothetical protein